MKKATDIPTQYEHVARAPGEALPVTKLQEQETNRKVTELLIQVEAQRRVIDRLTRDVKRLKDQISELAGKVQRG